MNLLECLDCGKLWPADEGDVGLVCGWKRCHGILEEADRERKIRKRVRFCADV